ncbi:MAG TPA: antitoxin MazE family protein, partial [Terriglobales bacterium]
TRTSSTTSRDKVRAYRKRLRQQGLRPIQIWVPDVSSPGFAKQAHRQSRFDGTKSITICPFTRNPAERPRLRLAVEPDGENELRTAC